VVDTTDPSSEAAGVAFWEELTAAGGEAWSSSRWTPSSEAAVAWRGPA